MLTINNPFRQYQTLYNKLIYYYKKCVVDIQSLRTKTEYMTGIITIDLS